MAVTSTTVAMLLTMVRNHLVEPSARFWTDAELISLMNLGVHDLWGAINDNYKDYFATLDITNVTLTANSTSLTGVPADVFRIKLIEPRDLTSSSSNTNLVFIPCDYDDPSFFSARSMDAQDPSNTVIYYAMMNEGAPISAPTVKIAPKVNSAVNLSMMYVPTLATITALSVNPIPGESDAALVAWTVGFALAKESSDHTPDAGWLGIYANEKQNLLVRMTPRQIQQEEVVSSIFELYW